MNEQPDETGPRPARSDISQSAWPGPAPSSDTGPRIPSPSAAQQPSWFGYAKPMQAVRDGYQRQLHPRYWEGQLVAAARGPMDWGLWAFVGGFGGYYLLSLVVIAASAGTFTDFDSSTRHSFGPLLLVAFLPNLVLGLVPAAMSWWKGQGLRRDYGVVPTPRDVWTGLACGGIAVGVGLLANLLLIVVFRSTPTQANPLQALNALSGGRTVWLGFAALFVFLGAPLTEELLVRGALWGALEHYKLHRYIILIFTSLIFALMHQDPERALALFCQGIAIGSSRMITGRIGSSMVAHATNNLLPALVLFFAA